MSALAFVLLLKLTTNEMAPRWDMEYYLDMAHHGIVRNGRLEAPFAYRPAAAVLSGLAGRWLHIEPLRAFRYGSVLAASAMLVLTFCLVRVLAPA